MVSTLRFDKWEDESGTQSVNIGQIAGGGGLVPIIPTSVSINAGSSSFDSLTGEISFTGGSTLTVNGIFSSEYSNYRIIYEFDSSPAAAEIFGQLKNSSGTLTTQYRYWVYQLNQSTFQSQYVATSSNLNLGRTQGASGTYMIIDMVNVGNARRKRTISWSTDEQISGTRMNLCGSLVAYTDLVIYPNGTTATDGKMKVYGYN
jgi:hypothetical protein